MSSVVAYPDFYVGSMFTTGVIDTPPEESGNGGMEAFDGEAWIECDQWFWYADPGNNIDFVWNSFAPQAGGQWRLTPSMELTIGGNPLMPRSGTFTDAPAMKAGGPKVAKWSLLDAKRSLTK